MLRKPKRVSQQNEDYLAITQKRVTAQGNATNQLERGIS